MLTTFPLLLNFQMIAPFLLRVSLASALIIYCYRTIRKDDCSPLSCWRSLQDNWLKSVVVFQIIISALLFIGLFTQITAALALVGVAVKEFIFKKRGEKYSDTSLLILFVAICLSLLVLGPGIFSLDLPL